MKAGWVGLLVVFVLFSVPVFSGQGEDFFSQAVERYQAGDYDASIRINERLLNEAKIESAPVYFNLGNSYFKSGKSGKAVVNYLRAQSLSPRDADIKANLAFARQAVEQGGSEKIVSVRNRWFDIFRALSMREFKWFAAVALMLTGTICLLSLFAGLPSKRVLLFTGIAAAITAYILIAFSVCFVDSLGRAVVLTRAEARFEPSDQATVYYNLSEGAEVKVIRQKDGWKKVQRSDGKFGWVIDQSIERI